MHMNQLVRPLLRYMERRVEQREVGWGHRTVLVYMHRVGDSSRPFTTLSGIRQDVFVFVFVVAAAVSFLRLSCMCVRDEDARGSSDAVNSPGACISTDRSSVSTDRKRHTLVLVLVCRRSCMCSAPPARSVALPYACAVPLTNSLWSPYTSPLSASMPTTIRNEEQDDEDS